MSYIRFSDEHIYDIRDYFILTTCLAIGFNPNSDASLSLRITLITCLDSTLMNPVPLDILEQLRGSLITTHRSDKSGYISRDIPECE